ncbi:MAG TPA: nucleoside triphosphate pyrophosphatase [Chloroflexota bacterium]|nr:nucleoside triphosphate pyrophosphatase [Chloroflexota bacterium]
MPATSSPLILASSSPRRRELLGHLGIPFQIDPSNVDESPIPGLTIAELVRALATAKAREVAARHPDSVVVGADTLVDLEGEILAKPRDPADARRMLRLLSGRVHHVHTGLAVCRANRMVTRVVTASVHMRAAPDDALAAYVAGGEPLDKAGAYAAQGEGAAFITRVEGSNLAVVGLPLLALRELLTELGVAVPAALTILEALERGERQESSSPRNV